MTVHSRPYVFGPFEVQNLILDVGLASKVWKFSMLCTKPLLLNFEWLKLNFKCPYVPSLCIVDTFRDKSLLEQRWLAQGTPLIELGAANL